MKTFRDSKNREWTVDVNLATMMRVKDSAGVNLTELSKGDPPLGVRLTTDPFLVADVLTAILQPQLERANVKPHEFLEGLNGEGLAGAFAALTEGLVDFFQKSGRTEQAAALTAQMKALVTAARMATAKIEGLDVDKLIETEIGKKTAAA